MCRGGVTTEEEVADALKVWARESCKKEKNALYDFGLLAYGPMANVA